MLGLDFIRAERASVEKAIEAKGIELDVDDLLSLDGDVRRLKTEIEALRAERNAISARFRMSLRMSARNLDVRPRKRALGRANWRTTLPKSKEC